jgi:sigma-54 specific flagellar transcriptional regulator A
LQNQPQFQKIPAELAVTALPVAVRLPEQGVDLKGYLTELESSLIVQALSECNNVVARAADRLNIRRTTLVEKMRKYDIQRSTRAESLSTS